MQHASNLSSRDFAKDCEAEGLLYLLALAACSHEGGCGATASVASWVPVLLGSGIVSQLLVHNSPFALASLMICFNFSCSPARSSPRMPCVKARSTYALSEAGQLFPPVLDAGAVAGCACGALSATLTYAGAGAVLAAGPLPFSSFDLGICGRMKNPEYCPFGTCDWLLVPALVGAAA